MIAALQHMTTHHQRLAALVAGWLSWNAGMAVDTATGNTEAGVWTQLGVAGLVIVAALYMLRRSDSREATDRAAIDKVERELVRELRSQIDALSAENDRLKAMRPPNARTRSTD